MEEKKTPEQIWEEELDELLEHYNKWWDEIMKEENEEFMTLNKRKKGKTKKKMKVKTK